MSNPLLLTCAPHWSDDRVARWGDSYAGAVDLRGDGRSAALRYYIAVDHPAGFGKLTNPNGNGNGGGILSYYGEIAHANGYD